MNFKGKRICRKNARARWTSLAGAGVVALLAISAVSCKKSEAVEPASPITVSEFKASAGGHSGDGKTTLDDYRVYWTYGDDAMVFSDGGSTGQRYVAEGGFGTDKTNFKAAGAAVSGTKFYAVYPYGAASGTFTSTNKTVQVTIPSVQTCNEAGNFANGANVMAAYSTVENSSTANEVPLTFYNVCGLLRLTLKGSATVKAITVKSKGGDKLSGTGTITFSETNPTDETPTTHKLDMDGSSTSDAVCLSCPSGVRLTSTGDGVQFNLVVAPCPMANGFDVSVVCEEGSFVTSTDKANKIEAGKILGMPAVYVTAVSHDVDGMLPGLFSVSATEKVHFSKGNMYWDGDSYEFEANQYDYRMHYEYPSTSADYNATAVIYGVQQATPTNTVGSFVWVKHGHSVKPYKWNVQSSELSGCTDSDVLFTNADDDATAPNAGFTVNGQAGVWRALSGGGGGEWKYLLDSRTTSYTSASGNVTANRRYAEVKVNGVCGLLVFPDEFSWPTGAGDEPTVFNKYSSSWNGVDYTAAQFSVLEAAGCVFLPCAGSRLGTSVYYVGTYGYYWSSLPIGSNAFNLGFHSGDVDPAKYSGCHTGRSVRLVR